MVHYSIHNSSGFHGGEVYEHTSKSGNAVNIGRGRIYFLHARSALLSRALCVRPRLHCVRDGRHAQLSEQVTMSTYWIVQGLEHLPQLMGGHSNVIFVQPVTRSQLNRQLALFCFLLMIHMMFLVNSNKDDVMNMLSVITVVNWMTGRVTEVICCFLKPSRMWLAKTCHFKKFQ